jgi:O-acetyl-ADP-ribose deacetylase (regulator of RNase III)
MIKYIKADLFTTPDKIIAHGCNAQGVMGSGVALLVKQKYPWAYDYYKKCVRTSPWDDVHTEYFVGNLYPVMQDGITIANCITQNYYGRDPSVRYVSYDGVDRCMKALSMHMFENNFHSVSMPKIGAGLGGGKWPIIASIVRVQLVARGLNVNIYDPALEDIAD